MKKLVIVLIGIVISVATYAQYNDADFLARDPYAGATFNSTGMVTSNYTIPVAEIYEPFSPSSTHKARKAGGPGDASLDDDGEDQPIVTPIGDATLPLLLFAAAAMGIVYLRRKKLITDN